jgi:hypothetical protein
MDGSTGFRRPSARLAASWLMLGLLSNRNDPGDSIGHRSGCHALLGHGKPVYCQRARPAHPEQPKRAARCPGAVAAPQGNTRRPSLAQGVGHA